MTQANNSLLLLSRTKMRSRHAAALTLIWAALACSSPGEDPGLDMQTTGPDELVASGGAVGDGAASGGASGGDAGNLASGGAFSSGGASAGGSSSSGGSSASGGAGSGSGGQLEGSGGAADEHPDDPAGTTPITIWLAGDSTVANGNTPCPSGWGKFFGSVFNEHVTIVNSAVGGGSVRTWLYDITADQGGDGECIATMTAGKPTIQARWTNMLSKMSEGDYLFIQFGINDGDRSCPRHVGTAAFKQEYAMMARAAIERGAQPVFVTPVSSIKCSGATAVNSRGFLSETKDVGQAEGVPVIDLHQLSIDLYQSLSFCPVPGGGVSASTTGAVGDFFCDDHTHFADAGAVQIAKVVAQAIRDAQLPLSAYLKE